MVTQGLKQAIISIVAALLLTASGLAFAQTEPASDSLKADTALAPVQLKKGPPVKGKPNAKDSDEEADQAKGSSKQPKSLGASPFKPASTGKPEKTYRPGKAFNPDLAKKLKGKNTATPTDSANTLKADGKRPPAPPAPKPSSGVRGQTERPAPSAATPAKALPVQMGNAEEERTDFKGFNKGEKYYIDYYDQDLIEFVKQMSEKFKVNFIISDSVKGGKITIISPNPVTREEAWQAFLSALNSKDLALTRVGKFYKIIKSREAERNPMKTYLNGGSTDPTEEFVTYLLKLKHLEIKDIERVLKDLKSKEGNILSFEPTNSLIITDTAINIRRMLKIINELDLPSGRDAIHVIDIYYASAADVAEKLQQIFGDKGGSKSKSTATKSTRSRGKSSKSTPDESDATQVTMSNVLADERTNQLIVVAPRSAMPKILDMINRLDVPIPGDGQVHVFYLENANAEELASTLTGLAGRGNTSKSKSKGKGGQNQGELFEGEVKITADKATNSLVITASTKDFNQLKKVIKKLDLRRRQVFVEAVIMEVTLKRDNAQGIAMNGGYTFDIGGEQVPLFAGTTLGTMSSVAIDPTTLSGLAVGLQGPDLEGTEGLLGEGVSLPSFGVMIQMIQTDSNANVLQTPHILTMDNEEAEIIVGSNVPFVTGSARDSNNQPVLSIQRQDVALTLKIKPQINESDYVRLQVQQEITELVSISETLGPTTTKRAAKSVVVVKDNQTIVIGGLIRDVQKADSEKVPFLGDIPILGRLFRRDKDNDEKTNLLIFLTPHIIKDEDDFKKIFKRKMDERNEFLRKFYGTEEDYEFEVDYSQKTGIVETIRSTYEEELQSLQVKTKETEEMLIVPESGHQAYEVGLTDGPSSSSTSAGEDTDEAKTPASASRPDPTELMRRLTGRSSRDEADE